MALEDHAVRACLAALDVQAEAQQLAVEVRDRDGVDLQLRVGLNSGQVIAGEIGSGACGYTAIGEQVGMAQRMESAAPPGGVMLSESTARLVERRRVLGEPELVQIKGADDRCPRAACWACRTEHRAIGDTTRHWSADSGRLAAVEGVLDGPIDGHGAVVGLVGPPGIGKSRLVRRGRGEGQSPRCRRCHRRSASPTPTRSLFMRSRGCCAAPPAWRALTTQSARAPIRAGVADADAEDLLLLDDLLGIGDPAVPPPDIAPDARRRRLDRAGQRRVVGPLDPRPSMSSRMRIGLTRSASRCSPISSRSSRRRRHWS